MSLRDDIESLAAAGAAADRETARAAFARLREALSAGAVRAAEPDASSAVGWRVNAWVKQGILLGFRFGDTVNASMDHGKWPFYDKDTLPLRRFPIARLAEKLEIDYRRTKGRICIFRLDRSYEFRAGLSRPARLVQNEWGVRRLLARNLLIAPIALHEAFGAEETAPYDVRHRGAKISAEGVFADRG
jgi:hypothetical protein